MFPDTFLPIQYSWITQLVRALKSPLHKPRICWDETA